MAFEPQFISGANDTRIATYEFGDPAGMPVLLIHGWSQSHLSWIRQINAPELSRFRMVLIDKRGHGASDKPAVADAYTDGDLWADDIAAVMSAKALVRPVIVAWSYGAIVTLDYVEKYGQSNVGGLVFANAAYFFGGPHTDEFFSPLIGECVEGMISDNVSRNIEATTRLMKSFCAKPLDTEAFEQALAYNMMVPPYVRAAMCSRVTEYESLLARLAVPVLIAHGEKDPVALVAHARYAKQHVPTAILDIYPESGHAIFLEEPARFNRSLAEFMDSLT